MADVFFNILDTQLNKCCQLDMKSLRTVYFPEQTGQDEAYWIKQILYIQWNGIRWILFRLMTENSVNND